MEKERDRVGDVDLPVVVRVGSIGAGELAAAEEEDLEDSDRVREVDGAVVVGIAAAEEGFLGSTGVDVLLRARLAAESIADGEAERVVSGRREVEDERAARIVRAIG